MNYCSDNASGTEAIPGLAGPLFGQLNAAEQFHAAHRILPTENGA
jgi:hypothetical protein